MKKKTKIISIVLGILGIFVIFALANTTANGRLKAVVVKVSDRHLMVMGVDQQELISVGYTKEGNIGYSQGQEVLIYFDGSVMESYPAQLGNVQKIKIVKQKSEVTIPDGILKYCYSSHNNVTVTVEKLTNTGISLTIIDTNERPYNYSNQYKVNKKVKNENYTGIGYKIGEESSNSTPAYTRNGSSLYMARSR